MCNLILCIFFEFYLFEIGFIIDESICCDGMEVNIRIEGVSGEEVFGLLNKSVVCF